MRGLLTWGGGRPWLLVLALIPAPGCSEPGRDDADRPRASTDGAALVEAMDPASYTTVRGDTNVVRLESPLPGDTIRSPLTIRGETRGSWYFEGDFPLVLTDWDGRIIAEHYASAQGEWMTSDFVPFEGILDFEVPEDVGAFSRRGSLILRKDNPSGLPENDDALEITVTYPDPG